MGLTSSKSVPSSDPGSSARSRKRETARYSMRKRAVEAWVRKTGATEVNGVVKFVGTALGGALDIGARAFEMWEMVDKDKSGGASLHEIELQFRRLNLRVPKKKLKELFKKHDRENKGELLVGQFANFFYEVDSRDEMRELFVAQIGATLEDETSSALLKNDEKDSNNNNKKNKKKSAMGSAAKRSMASMLTPGASFRSSKSVESGGGPSARLPLTWTTRDLYNFYQTHYPNDPETKWTSPTMSECAEIIKKYVTQSQEARSRHTVFGSKVKKLLTEEMEGSASAARSRNSTQALRMDSRAFVLMLSDLDANNATAPSYTHRVYQDMSRPLSHYYVSASHNTYLEGGQLKSVSSPESIVRALELGVRVVEVDVWDGSDGEPIVNHGRTLCTPTSFRACVEAVNQYAFIVSKYPVILTIENHCSPAQQLRIASILQEVLKGKLYRPTLRPDSDLFSGPPEWLSPADLVNKVVIRDKPRKSAHHTAEGAGGGKGSSGVPQKRKSVKDVLFGAPKRTGGAATTNTTTTPTGGGGGTSSTTASSSGPSGRDGGGGGGGGEEGETPGELIQASQQGASTSARSLTSQRTGESSSIDMTSEDGVDPEARRKYIEEEDQDDFIDNTVEDEGVTAVVTRVDEEARRILTKGVGSIRMAINEMGIDDAKLPEWLKSGFEKENDSARSLLELIYVKNVKLRVSRTKEAPDTLDYDNCIHFVQPPWASSSSINETKMKSFVRPGASAAGMATYTLRHLVRCYPGAARTNSSNYDPVPAWSVGIQLAALNYQTKSPPVWVNQGHFMDNGAAGYVLKPRELLECLPCGLAHETWGGGGASAAGSGRKSRRVSRKQASNRSTSSNHNNKETKDDSSLVIAGGESTTTTNAPTRSYWDLKVAPDERPDELVVTIISAHYLPKPPSERDDAKTEIIDPYVNLYLFGLECDTGGPNSVDGHIKRTTKTINDNGFDPLWNERFSFSLFRPRFAHLLFEVRDQDFTTSEFIAQASVPVRLLRPGYRVLPLRSADCVPNPNGSFLFLKIEWKRASRA